MRQILYVSSKAPSKALSVGEVLITSRRNNEAAGVTGLLYTDGSRFLQVLEGEDEAVTRTFDRIRADDRHQAVVVLADRQTDAREFGRWSMAHRQPSDTADAFDARMAILLAGASASVRGTFAGLVAARRAG
jgi:hypothetical protein